MSYYVIPCAPIGPRELESRTVSIGHIARSCCYVVPVALLNKELRRQYCDMGHALSSTRRRTKEHHFCKL